MPGLGGVLGLNDYYAEGPEGSGGCHRSTGSWGSKIRQRAVWSSNTAGRGGNRLVVQSDGNLVMYSPNGGVWATGTTGR